MIRAVGLDLSAVSTGVALPDGRLFTIRPRATAKQPARRLHQIIYSLDQLLGFYDGRGGIDVAVIESYLTHGARGEAAFRLGEVGGAVRLRLFEKTIPYVEVKIPSLKKYGAGSGRATKDEMVAAAIADGASPANDDEADAYFLRRTALDRYGGQPDRLPDSIARLQWPDLTPGVTR